MGSHWVEASQVVFSGMLIKWLNDESTISLRFFVTGLPISSKLGAWSMFVVLSVADGLPKN